MNPEPTAARPSMRDRLQDYVQWYDGALTPAFCAQLITAFQQTRQQQIERTRGWRPGLEESAWTELDITPLADEAFRGFFYEQIDRYLARYNAHLGLTLPVPSSTLLAPLRMKRYAVGKGEWFQPHFDSINEVASRYLVFLWYLNDVAEGGETEFCDLDLKVDARAGRLLVFPPYWMYQHAGQPPRSNDKYILSTYLMFPSSSPGR